MPTRRRITGQWVSGARTTADGALAGRGIVVPELAVVIATLDRIAAGGRHADARQRLGRGRAHRLGLGVLLTPRAVVLVVAVHEHARAIGLGGRDAVRVAAVGV